MNNGNECITADGVYELDKTHSTVQFAAASRRRFDVPGIVRGLDARLVIENGSPELGRMRVVESVSIVEPRRVP